MAYLFQYIPRTDRVPYKGKTSDQAHPDPKNQAHKEPVLVKKSAHR